MIVRVVTSVTVLSLRPQEGPGEAAGGRVRVAGQGGGGAEDLPHRGEHLRVRRQLQELHRGARGAAPRAPGGAGGAAGAAGARLRAALPQRGPREGRRQGAGRPRPEV